MGPATIPTRSTQLLDRGTVFRCPCPDPLLRRRLLPSITTIAPVVLLGFLGVTFYFGSKRCAAEEAKFGSPCTNFSETGRVQFHTAPALCQVARNCSPGNPAREQGDIGTARFSRTSFSSRTNVDLGVALQALGPSRTIRHGARHTTQDRERGLIRSRSAREFGSLQRSVTRRLRAGPGREEDIQQVRGGPEARGIFCRQHLVLILLVQVDVQVEACRSACRLQVPWKYFVIPTLSGSRGMIVWLGVNVFVKNPVESRASCEEGIRRSHRFCVFLVRLVSLRAMR